MRELAPGARTRKHQTLTPTIGFSKGSAKIVSLRADDSLYFTK